MLLNKFRKLFGAQTSDNRQVCVGVVQTNYRQARNHNAQTDGRQRERSTESELSFVFLVNLIQEEVLCFLIVTPTHFNVSDVIFN